MPNSNGMGPDGRGPMTGRGMGPCGGARAWRPGCGRGYGSGHAEARVMGWAAVGYGPGGEASASTNMRAALEERKAYLRAELARTEALLSAEAHPLSRAGGDTVK